MEIWVGNDWVDESVCGVCFQPECPESYGGTRPQARERTPKLTPGQRDYRGYGEWALHPEEATFLLHRGYAIVEGRKQPVTFIHNEAFVTQVRVQGTGS